jgi:hypothetical protein
VLVELSKIGQLFSKKVTYKFMVKLLKQKNVLLNWYFSIKKKIEKDSNDF